MKDRLPEAEAEDAIQWAKDYIQRNYSAEALKQLDRDIEDWIIKVEEKPDES